ncbi:pumilio family mRNA-binding protein [Niveomyces insectorum RCEF 264]|uniref:Pumilio family mRNA-binding protein n=1 Tax=Niveomyces insectorum RCEF 264 TaxID=1081102 RepID=A0A167Y976_9HYPO|nr:pumilio family mRNA-binding protein [Niveomyces insectorum RCEF 264]
MASNRFPYAGSSAKDAPSQPLASNTFSSSNWQPNAIWGNPIGNPIASSLNKRDATVSRRGQDEVFATSHQNSNAFSVNSSDSTNVWAQSAARPWANADNNSATLRKTSASPSPARGRDTSSSAALHDFANGTSSSPAPYFAAIGSATTGAFASGRTSFSGTGPAADSTPANSFKYPASLRDSVADDGKDTTGAVNGANGAMSTFPPPIGYDDDALPSRARFSQDLSNGFTTASAAVSVSGSTASTTAPTVPAPNAAVGAAAAAASNAGGLPSFGAFGTLPPLRQGHHSHRPSLQTSTSFSSPAAPANALLHHRNSQPEDSSTLEMADMLRHKLHMAEQPADSSLNSFAGGFVASNYSAYPQASSAVSFQFNPGSQTWDAGNPSRANNFDAYSQASQHAADTFALAAYAATRGSLGAIDRGTTPVGTSYRQVNTPRSLGTPANATGPWSRPPSRDPRAASGLSDNGVAKTNGNLLQRQQYQSVLHDQQLAPPSLAAAAAAFNGNTNFFPNNIAPYPMYNPVRGPVPVPLSPFGVPLGASLNNAPFIPAAHFQMPRDRDPARALRSALLDEFRSSRTNRRYELKDIYCHIVEFSGDQHGSRFIQSKLETANSDEKEHVFREISANTLVLMKDVFGNYVVQKFFEHGNQVQKKYLAEQMKGKMVDLSTQTYACRVVQKALQHILVDQQVLLAGELEADVIRVVKDQNGNHVIQKIIELVPREHIGFVMDAFRGRVRELSSHNFGCRVVQRMLEYGSDDDKAAILLELHENTRDLIMDQFGNYVAQHVIQFGEPDDRARMIRKVLDELVPMSRHKFASNVVEKCIEHGSATDRLRIREELDKVGSDGVPVLQHLIKDQYGNYVIQKLLKQLKNEEHRHFVEALSVQLNVLKPSNPGRHNSAIDRLAVVVDDELSRINNAVNNQGSASAGPHNGHTAPASPQVPDDHDSTPSLTNAPNTPESSNPPSVSAGPAGEPLAAEMKEPAASAAALLDPMHACCKPTENPAVALNL